MVHMLNFIKTNLGTGIFSLIMPFIQAINIISITYYNINCMLMYQHACYDT